MFWNNIKVNKINKERIPKKHRNLLNHEDVMTLVLEKFYKQNMDVRVLESNITTNNNYLREIFLVGRIDKKIKEIAHIEIHLDNLPKEV
ncbi:hypothetical protein JW977_00455, partial [Candidatus Falkowbacteria bacterium]|nr:hypothetical protein [Candidatus Falkowbacteria bacterium]